MRDDRESVVAAAITRFAIIAENMNRGRDHRGEYESRPINRVFRNRAICPAMLCDNRLDVKHQHQNRLPAFAISLSIKSSIHSKTLSSKTLSSIKTLHPKHFHQSIPKHFQTVVACHSLVPGLCLANDSSFFHTQAQPEYCPSLNDVSQ